MRQMIEVRPFGDQALSVSLGEAANPPMLFRSGAKAEAAARALAVRLFDHGTPVEIVIGLRDGTVSGRFIARPTGA